MSKMLTRPEGGYARNTAGGMLSEQYAMGATRTYKAPTVRRVPALNVSQPRPLTVGSKIAHGRDVGTVVRPADRYRLGV